MLRLILMPLGAGIIATGGMTAFLWAVDRFAEINADMVRAVGSLFTKSYHNALGVGLLIHFVNGVIIAALYLHVLSLLSLTSVASETFVGGIMGFAQGFVVGWGVIRFAHRHPVKEFQAADYKVAVAHILAHVVYGLLIGALYGLMRVSGLDVSPGI